MIEEQHVTQYESLLDPLESWFQQEVFHQYNESYLYWSMLQQETDHRIKALWELHLDMEIGQLQVACGCCASYEGIDPEEILPPALPESDDVRGEQAVRPRGPRQPGRPARDGAQYVRLDELPKTPVLRVPGDGQRRRAPSETVIDETRNVNAIATTGTKPKARIRLKNSTAWK